MDPISAFRNDVQRNIDDLGKDQDLQGLSRIWVREVSRHKWAYNFTWLGVPAIQFPNDAWAVQELIWHVKPDLIIETGIAHGGSLMFSASMLALLDYSEAVAAGKMLDPVKPKRKVIGIDIDIRPHNRAAIDAHAMRSRIELVEGSSTAPDIIAKIGKMASDFSRIMVLLDSNHTHDHVVAELQAYAPMVSAGSYCIVFDTLVEDMPDDLSSGRPWAKGNNPKTAVWHYLKSHPEFEIDKSIPHKLLITVAPDGYLKRLR